MKKPTLNRRSLIQLSALFVAPVLGLSNQAALAQQVSRPAHAAVGQWRLIGRTQAAHTIDHDSIKVLGPFDDFRRLKFRVTDAPLVIYRIVVTYDSGDAETLDVRHNIRQGGETRAINLKGIGRRSIRRIDFWYETKGWTRGKADVSIFGMG